MNESILTRAVPPAPAVRRHRLVGILFLLPGLAVAALAIAGPWLTSADPSLIVAPPYTEAGGGLPLGADATGRDVWVRMLTGGRPLIVIPVVATVLTAVLGTALGAAAGYLGGWFDAVVSRFDALFLAFPPILAMLILLNGWGYSTATLIAAVVITGVPFVSRVARAATVQIVHSGFVDAAVALGDSSFSILLREILPNIVRPILADAGTRLAIAITLTASAGFLGFGPDAPNWGAMISENMEGITLTPWGVVAPAIGLAVLAVSTNLALDRLAGKIGS
ncbi:ABC transporter permease [Actinokineospora iranica]|uniref:Peptide/nickel transport system permease protein n=1 Tax=Actinokineospora iranica TaxID=1271860 RepID=A0A1G6W8W9_9PSEU|nr:ABC transporter permease [Actinokineospora iranica]SDD62258.1 peptide/nickel transport system permease protein [Actinokineospora iranica]